MITPTSNAHNRYLMKEWHLEWISNVLKNTRWGVEHSVIAEPKPNCPFSPSPQEYNSPSSVKQRAWLPPAAISNGDAWGDERRVSLVGME